ncbi:MULTISPECIES: 50S ribosomal protein L4 [Aeromicrobium]|jgi:large subunit ribosomal protein L4|uniref:Large ribosomal subunit protein uL4 n=1 Tax=Aeromicrobium erythreum TaxID=2041 RepID=A0A0U4BD85_9ACTN|nr:MULTISPECIES: 50S ribosomal protein L4 [Aeromicrobium]ALX05668.1 50S ribosomal protein L4 [Aeromicrobium erythreum]
MAVKTIDAALPVDIFGVQTNIPLIHQVVTAQLAAARQGTHDVKSRGEVSGGGKKPWRQKGTGRARAGSIRAPHFTGGGIVHGPTPRSYDQRTPKKMKAAALRGALSDRARSGRLHVVESLVTGEAPSTKAAVAAIAELTTRRRVLVVVRREDALTALSLRNVTDLVVLTFDQLNTYDVVLSDDVIFTQDAFEAFVAARSTEGAETIALSAAVVEADAKPAAKPAKKASAKKAPAAQEAPAQAEAAPATEESGAEGATKTQPYGPGSKAPLKSGNAPKGHEIKGNVDSMKFHTPDSPWYDQTVAEVWFDTEETAQAAGFEKAGE